MIHLWLPERECRPSGAQLHFLIISQGSAALHPGLRCRRTSGALVRRAPNYFDTPKVSDIGL
jgi:hypothetical protein